MMLHRLTVLVSAVLVLSSTSSVRLMAQSADDRFIQIYRIIKQADDLSEAGQPQQAYTTFLEAQAELKKLQAGNPSWNPKVIQFRLNYVAEKLSGLASRVPAAMLDRSREAAPGTITSPAAPSPDAQAQAAAIAEAQAESAKLRNDIQRLQNEKGLLEAKLREALLAQPAVVDPREMARAETRIRELQKENDVIRITLESQKAKLANAIDPAEHDNLKRSLSEAQKKIIDQEKQLARRAATTPAAPSNADRERIEALRQENDILKQQLAAAKTGNPGTEAANRRVENLERQLKQAQQELETERRTGTTLRDQLRRAEADIADAKQLVKSRETALADLEKERNSLQKLAARKAREEGGPDPADLEKLSKLEKDRAKIESDLAGARKELKSSQSSAEQLKKEKAELESQLKKAAREASKAAEAQADRVKKMEKEREELLARLAASKKSRSKNSDAEELAKYRERIEILEAKRVPFTPEELALFKEPPARLPAPTETAKNATATATDKRKAARNLPNEAAPLVAEAQRAFQNKRFEEAEQKYQQVLKLDAANASTLANIAVIQMEQNRLDEAEKNLLKAVDEAPEDARNWSLMGILRFRQKQFDQAFDALSKSAGIDPTNAETQNYLGITLSEKGQRIPAEAALRKAIQLQPGYGNAHHNLAIIYVTQKPPFTELARWHYQKAISSGHPRNNELERLLDSATPAAKTP